MLEIEPLARLFDESVERFRPFHRLMREELDFSLKLDHYYDDSGGSKDPQRIQPRGREIKQRINHTLGEIVNSRIYFQVRPLGGEPMNDALAEILKGALEWQMYHHTNGIEDPRERALLQAIAARHGYIAVEFDRNIPPYGEIVIRHGDGRCLMWPAPFQPHSPQCPWVLEARRLTIAEAKRKRGWRNVGNLQPDRGYLDDGETYGGDVPGRMILDRSDKPEWEMDAKAFTCAWLYERGLSDTTSYESKMDMLDPEDQYQKCTAPGCDFQTATQGELGIPLEPQGQCPQCGGMAELQMAVLQSETKLANRGGRRLTIFSPYNKEIHVGKPGWPYDMPRRLAPLPFASYQFEHHPLDPIGASLTFEQKTLQLAKDMVVRLGLEHMMLAKPYIKTLEGIEDGFGNPWGFGPEQGLQMLDKSGMPNSVELIQAAGLPAAWAALNQAITSDFAANTGTDDLGLTPQNSKDIAASTISQYIEQGGVATRHLGARVRRSDTHALQSINHLIHACWTDKRWIDFQGKDGQWRSMAVMGDDLADYNVVVTTNPELAKIDAQEIGAWQTFLSMPAPAREFVARRLGLPMSEVMQLAAAEQQMMQQQAQMQMQAQAAMRPAPQGNGHAPNPAMSRMGSIGG